MKTQYSYNFENTVKYSVDYYSCSLTNLFYIFKPLTKNQTLSR